jgi:FkbM family methyltransferase
MNALETAVRTFKRGLGLSSGSRLVARMRPAYDSLLNFCYGRRGLVRLLNGQDPVRIRPAHRYAVESYEPAVFDYLKRYVQPGMVVLDVGAHVGLFTMLLARWAGPPGRVFAFEPAPLTRAALIDHLALNEMSNRVSVLPLAVSDQEGSALLYTVANSPENTLSATHGRLPQARGAPVTVTTIDAFCASRSLVPSLIKIDIEGFEVHALRGARRILDRHRPVVIVEMHPMNWPEIGMTSTQAEQLLGELNYRLRPLDGQANPFAEYGHVALEPIESVFQNHHRL